MAGSLWRNVKGDRRHRRRMRIRAALSLTTLCLGLGMLSVGTSAAQEEQSAVDVIELEGIIDPTSSGYLLGRLSAAEDNGAHAAIVRLDTPGGLDVSMRDIVQAVLDSDVPVVVWVAPRGARAASAGTFITLAAHRAYMAEATELGAATPVSLEGEQPEELQRKVTEDAAAFIRGIAEARDRNIEWAEEAVREGASLSAPEAVEMNVIDGIASSLGDLLEEIDGESVELASGSTIRLETWSEAEGTPSVTIRFQGMNVLQRLLHAVTNPEIAFLLITIGVWGLIFELFNPGIGLAGILGGVCLLLGFYALSVLPTNWAGVGLLILAMIFFVVDLQTAGLGIWTIGGLAALIAGSLILFSGADPSLQLSPWAIVAVVAGTVVFFISVMTAALRVRLRRPITGEEALVGMVGEAQTDIAPEGTVLTKGTLWRARTMETGIGAGSKVKVMATEGLVLLVEPLHEPSHERESHL
jgi:membrane-bound serine protease (ClpP class)